MDGSDGAYWDGFKAGCVLSVMALAATVSALVTVLSIFVARW